MIREIVARRAEIREPFFPENEIAREINESGRDTVYSDRVPYGLLTAQDNQRDILIRHKSIFLEHDACQVIKRASARRQSDHLTFEILHGLDLFLRDHAENRHRR